MQAQAAAIVGWKLSGGILLTSTVAGRLENSPGPWRSSSSW